MGQKFFDYVDYINFDFVPENKGFSILDDINQSVNILTFNDYSYQICDNMLINYQPPNIVGKNILLSVSQTDIDNSINNIVRKSHNLASSYVDVSVFDSENNEIMIGLQIVNSNEIDLNFDRITIPDGETWKILVEV